MNTKLYFGNLPYSVDSAQLAAIIQDYGSPELIEVSKSQLFLLLFLFFVNFGQLFFYHVNQDNYLL